MLKCNINFLFGANVSFGSAPNRARTDAIFYFRERKLIIAYYGI